MVNCPVGPHLDHISVQIDDHWVPKDNKTIEFHSRQVHGLHTEPIFTCLDFEFQYLLRCEAHVLKVVEAEVLLAICCW